MKTIAIGSIFAVLALMIALPSAFADHAKVDVSMPEGTSIQGCEVNNECYIPYDPVVDVGGEVTWTNDDSAVHTVTSGTIETGPQGVFAFDTDLISPEQQVTHVFEEAGEVPYYCMVHPYMKGIIVVQETLEDDHDGDGMEQKDANAMAMTTDGSLTVNIFAGAPAAGEEQTVEVKFTDAEGKSSNHVNYDIAIMQDGEELASETGHVHPGDRGSHTVSAVSENPLDIQVTVLGFGLPGTDPATWTGPVGQTVSLSVVPEFGPIAMIVLAVAIVSIVAVTTKSKVIPRL